MPDNAPDPCQRCGAPTVAIDLLGGDAQMTMHSCSRCDHRVWFRGGRPAGLRDVLHGVSAGSAKRTSA